MGLLTAHASLDLVNNTLPVHAILTGWQPPSLVELLRSRGITLHSFEPVAVPNWAKLWYRGTFAKLNVLRLAAKLRSRVLFLDNDVIAFANLDHLTQSPAPAFVFRDYDGHGDFRSPGSGLNSGVVLLPALNENQVAEFFRMHNHHLSVGYANLRNRSLRVGLDGGDQTCWNYWLQLELPRPRKCYELSARYNTYSREIGLSGGANASSETDKREMMISTAKLEGPTHGNAWWRDVKLWHKPHEYSNVRGLTSAAKAFVDERVSKIRQLAMGTTSAEVVGITKLPREEATQPLRWCEERLVLETFVRAPAIQPPLVNGATATTTVSLREAKTRQVQQFLRTCMDSCRAAGKGATWVSVCLQIDACTCHQTCERPIVGRARSAGFAFGLRSTWTESPLPWFAAKME